MKKVIAILLALSLALGCAFALAEDAADDKAFVITLTANPTTGYAWSYALTEEDFVTVEEEFLTSEDIDRLAGVEPAAEPMVGESGLSVFTIKGVKPGDVVIALEYSQSWDESSTVAGITYTLRVNEDLSVVCVASTLGV